MGLGITGLLEVVAIDRDLGAVLALARPVGEVPPSPGHVVVKRRAARGMLMVGHRIVVASQRQLVGQPQRVVPVEGQPHPLLASAALPAIVSCQPGTPGFLWSIGDLDLTTANIPARLELHFRLVRRQAIELVDHLLQLAQINQIADMPPEKPVKSRDPRDGYRGQV